VKLNPELQRNLWLELGPQRLLAMPVVLGLVFALTYLVADNVAAGWASVAVVAAVVYGLATVLWGTHMAGDAVLTEVAARTWDWQRMSSIDPWTMTWGKLFGSTVYAWYAALICLPVFVVALAGRDEVDSAWWVGMLLSGALLAHALGLIWSLLLVHDRHGRDQVTQRRSSTYLLLLLILLGVVPWLSDPLQHVTRWYDTVETDRAFALTSLAVFAAWAVVGAYRLMRVELQFRNAPWVWLGFTVFLMIYLAGFIDPGGRLYASYLVGMLLVAVVAFTTPRDLLQLRRLGQALKANAWMRAGQQFPPWLLSLLLVAALGLGVLLLPAGASCSSLLCPDGFGSRLLAVLLMLFLLRDLGILWLVSLGGRSRRPELATVIYLIVLYTIVPGLLGTLGADDWTALFLPRADLSTEWAVIAALPGPLLVAVMLWRQARRRRVTSQG